jgi:hypothetical protein
MFDEIRAALNQWTQDTKYIAKTAPSDWGKRAMADAVKRVSELMPKLDAMEQEFHDLKAKAKPAPINNLTANKA